MKKEGLSPAAKFWIGIAVYVIAADTILWRRDHKTMSIQWGDWLQTRRGQIACSATWGVLTAHLFWKMPLPFQTSAKRVLGGKKEI